MAELRVAIIGYGLAGRVFHAPLVAAADGLELSTVVTSDPERRAAIEREYPQAEVLGAPEELWARSAEHELVVVATPNDVHAALAAQAIERGIPVVVDKPLALNAHEAQELIARAQDAGVLLTVFQNRRWDSDILTLKRLLAEDRLGDVIRFESRFERWQPEPATGAWRFTTSPQLGGGVLLDLGSHLVDQALELFGPVTHVYAEVQAVRGQEADDDGFIALSHATGVTSHLRTSAVTAAPGPRLRVLGTRAAFIVSGVDSQEDQLAGGERPRAGIQWGAEPESRWGRLVQGEDSVPVPSERGDWPAFYAALAGALRDGGPPPVDPRDALATLRVLEAARDSAARQATVVLAP